jgi:hypothetical protein
LTGADFLQLDPADAPPRGMAAWLTTALRAALTDGRLDVGARLPPSRTLAAQLGVSRGVVVAAYQRLVDEGLLVGHRGGGTSVRAAPAAPGTVDPPAPEPVAFDLSPGLPDLSAFPRQAWLRAERAVLAGLVPADLGYGDPRGAPACGPRWPGGSRAPAASAPIRASCCWSTASPRVSPWWHRCCGIAERARSATRTRGRAGRGTRPGSGA